MSSATRYALNNFFWIRQAVFLMPLCLMLASLKIMIPAESIEAYFYPLREKKDFFYYSLYNISQYGNFIFYFIYAIILARSVRNNDRGGIRFCFSYVIVQLTVTLFTVHFFKMLLGRPRPYAGEQEWQSFNTQDRYHSLPSGHTAEIFGAASPLGQLLRNFFVVFLFGLIPALMGFSRIYLGMHHVSDVMAGAVIGTFSTYCILRLSQTLPLPFTGTADEN